MKWISYLVLIGFAWACSPKSAYVTHSFPDPVDTSDKPILLQEKKVYNHGDVYADNMFDGARMNDFNMINDTTFRVVVSPENKPINESAYYAFRIWSKATKNIDLQIEYTHHPHRYIPKLSYDRENWITMDTADFDTLTAPNLARLKLQIGPKVLWVAGQELYTSGDMADWCSDMAKHDAVHHSIIGKSKLDRDMHYLDIYQNNRLEKPTIVIISRQHPPEVSGQKAMISYVEELLNDSALSKLFRQRFRVLVYPMMNPDGVDLGHWRHTAGGIDMNRDWSQYRQPEVALMTQHCVKTTSKYKNKVLVGLDFHSTQEDVFYTLTPDLKSSIFPFKDLWYEAIDTAIDEPIGDDAPYSLNQPISKGWFYLQFNAEGITYEVGDETPRELVDRKARVAAREMMKLLILK